jgi:hypothetical protein
MPRQAGTIQWSVSNGKAREARATAARASFFPGYIFRTRVPPVAPVPEWQAGIARESGFNGINTRFRPLFLVFVHPFVSES